MRRSPIQGQSSMAASMAFTHAAISRTRCFCTHAALLRHSFITTPIFYVNAGEVIMMSCAKLVAVRLSVMIYGMTIFSRLVLPLCTHIVSYICTCAHTQHACMHISTYTHTCTHICMHCIHNGVTSHQYIHWHTCTHHTNLMGQPQVKKKLFLLTWV